MLHLLTDRSLGVTFADVWFNDWNSLPPDPDPYRGPTDGAILAELLRGGGIIANGNLPEGVAAVGDRWVLPQVVLAGGIVLALLSPGVTQLDRLRRVWRRTLYDASLDSQGPSAVVLADKARRKGVDL